MARRPRLRQLRREVRGCAEEAADAADTERADPTSRGPGLPSTVPPPRGRAFVGTGFRQTAPRRSGREEPAEPEVLPRTPSLGELLEEITEARARGRARYEVEDAPWARRPAEPRRPGFPLAGCLVRIVGLVFLLIAAAIIFLFLLFGGFIVD